MENWQLKVQSLQDKAKVSYDAGDYISSVMALSEAIQAVPEPQLEHGEMMLLLMAISESHRELGNYDVAEKALKDAHSCPKIVDVAFLQVKKGILYHRMGDEKIALSQFYSAFLNGGEAAFAGEEQYYELIKDAVSDLDTEENATSSPQVKDTATDAQTEDEGWLEDFDFSMFGAEESFGMAQYDDAIKYFEEALSFVPGEKYSHYETTRAVAGLIDCYYFKKDFAQAISLINELEHDAEGLSNAFVKLRKGQVYYDLGDTEKGINELMAAYMLGGEEIFEGSEAHWDLIANTVHKGTGR